MSVALHSTVLLVHHDPEVRARLEVLLGEMGYPFVSVHDGDGMRKSFAASMPEIVIVGWGTPGVDPMDLCRRIRDRADGVSFVMVVTDGSSEYGSSLALAAGADDYVERPVRPNQFRARMEIAERVLAVARARRSAESETVRLRGLAGIGQKCLALQHEINNPLSALYALLEMVGMSVDLPAAAAADIKESLVQAKRIAAIVRRIPGERYRTPEFIADQPMPAYQAFATATPTPATRISP